MFPPIQSIRKLVLPLTVLLIGLIDNAPAQQAQDPREQRFGVRFQPLIIPPANFQNLRFRQPQFQTIVNPTIQFRNVVYPPQFTSYSDLDRRGQVSGTTRNIRRGSQTSESYGLQPTTNGSPTALTRLRDRPSDANSLNRSKYSESTGRLVNRSPRELPQGTNFARSDSQRSQILANRQQRAAEIALSPRTDQSTSDRVADRSQAGRPVRTTTRLRIDSTTGSVVR